MKPKFKTTAVLFRSKPQASQGRTSLQRIKEDIKRRSLRVLLSPLPHFPHFKSPRTSITNLTPLKKNAYKRGISQDGLKVTDQQIEKLRQHVSTPKIKKQRRNTKRKNEAEKLREELLSKNFIADNNLFGSKRALRSRLILTPKSPLVRVKRTARQGVKSRKISLNSLNKFLSRDVVVELEKLPCDKAPLENEVSKVDAEEPVRINENDRRSPVRFPPVRDITILLEKLSPTITQRFEPKKMDEVPCTSTVVSDKELALESPPNDTQVSGIAFDPSKHAPLREIRILLDKLPDTYFAPETETTRSVEPDKESVAVPQPDDMVVGTSLESLEKLHDTAVDQSIDKSPRKETPTLSQQALLDQTTVDPESLSTQVITPTPGQADTTEMSAKKTPKSLDIPLRRITIAKSKFTKMNRALESPVSPARIRPHSAYLTSPLGKMKSWKSKTTTPATITESTSSSKSSASDTVSSSSSTLGNVASGETSRSSIASISSSHSQEVPSSAPKPLSDTITIGVSSRTKSGSSKYTGSKSTHWSDKSGGDSSKSSNKTKPLVTKVTPKTLAAIPEKEKSTPLPPARSPSSVQSVPLCTEVSSPLSRGQLLAAKSLAASPIVPKMPLKSPSRSRTSKSEKPYAKSPLNRGRLMTEQSLASSSSSVGEKSRSSSVGTSLHRSLSNVSTSSKEQKNVPYKQKWSSASDLLKMSTTDTVSDSSNDMSSVAIPLDPTPAPGVFSNSKTCAAILSTLGIADRNKSKSAPQKLSQWSTSEPAKSTSTLPKKTPHSSKTQTATKSVSRSQSDLSKKLAGVQIDSTKPSQTSTSQPTPIQRKPFHIPKVVPGVSGFYKTSAKHPSSLPHSGFTPSPPTKSMVIRPVLDMGTSMYPSASYSATNSRQLPVKSSLPSRSKPSTTTSCFKTPLAKPYYSTSSHSTLKPSCTPLLQTATPKPLCTSSSQSSTITKPVSISRPLPVASKPQTPGFHQSLTAPTTIIPPAPSTKLVYTPSTTKPRQSSSSHVTFAKPSTHVTYTPPVKPSYVPFSQPTKIPSSTATPSKTNIPIKPGSGIKPLTIKTPSGQSSHKSKPRPFKTAYMSSRSSNSDSFSKCLPSGPQYSPTYSKYLQNGFSCLPAAQYKMQMPTPAKPLSPGTKKVLNCPTVKPWIPKRPVSPPSGPSGSLTTSKLTANPSFSPLCPEF